MSRFSEIAQIYDKAPYVCTGCTKQNHCRKQHAYYSAYKADKKSRALLSESRKNIHASEEQTARLNELFTPLVLNGQSVSRIFANHSEEIDFSRRTIYNYIDKCVFDVRNIDLPRKVRYKKRKTKPSEPAQYACRQERTYADFKAFMESHPELDIVEMDTVKGRREKGKCLLTMIFTKYDLMLIFLIESASQKCVQAVFDELTEKLGTETFQRLFPVILTDNGEEFKAPDSLENTDYGVRRTNIFYCQPMHLTTTNIYCHAFNEAQARTRNAIAAALDFTSSLKGEVSENKRTEMPLSERIIAHNSDAAKDI